MIYLLHFDPPVKRAKHYLGYCADERLQLRLIEHARGDGASLTRAAIKQGSKLYLARTLPGKSYEVERAMKVHGDFKRLCPLCCPMFAKLASEVYEIDPKRPEQPPPHAVLDWKPEKFRKRGAP